MKRIGFVTQKGGGGKSTSALALASALSKKGTVAIIDLDRQESLAKWYKMAAAVPGLEVFVAKKPEELKTLSGYDYAIIDTAGVLSADVLPYLDVVLVPVVPSVFDVWAMADSIDLIKAHQSHRPELKAALFVNRLQPTTKLGREVVEALKAYEMPILRSVLHHRTAYPTCIAQGKTPVTSGDSEIRLESLRFAEAVRNFISGEKNGTV